MEWLTIGTPVMKYSGDYNELGIIVGLLYTPEEKRRVVVAHPGRKGWFLHIYAPENLRETLPLENADLRATIKKNKLNCSFTI